MARKTKTQKKGEKTKSAKTAKPRALTLKQEAFIAHYAATLSATEAYKLAGYKQHKDPQVNANEAYRLSRHPEIAPRLAQLTERTRQIAEEQFDLSIERVLRQYAAIAFADAGDFYEWGPEGVTLKDSKTLTVEQRRIVSHVVQTKGNTSSIEVKLNDRMKALDAISRHLGLFEVDNAQKSAGPAYLVAEDHSV